MTTTSGLFPGHDGGRGCHQANICHRSIQRSRGKSQLLKDIKVFRRVRCGNMPIEEPAFHWVASYAERRPEKLACRIVLAAD
jgi:hypothetical protein